MKIQAKLLLALIPVLLTGCTDHEVNQKPALCQPTIASADTVVPENFEYKKVTDAEQKLSGLYGTQIEKLAEGIAEVDEWLYAPDEETPARKLIDDAIEKLRARITSEVTALTKSAIAAPKGKEAADILSKVNALLVLYPVPKTGDQRKSLEDISAHILATSRRVEDIRRLRYNQWSAEQIKKGMDAYHKKTSWLTSDKDKEALLKICTDYIRYLDSGFMEPAVLNLYTDFLHRCDSKMDDDHKVKLALSLVDPSLQRYSPSMF
ncbi:MAG: hypothetical protein Q8O37_16680 [Sulfuricellaceae bacterium]|nr:hypothetical protein [Sulfuricellaceae bacterium]